MKYDMMFRLIGADSADKFDFFKAMDTFTEDAKTFVGQYAAVIGVILLAFGVLMFGMAVMGKQGQAKKAIIGAVSFLVGGFFLVSGFSRSERLAKGMGETMDGWSKGTKAGDGKNDSGESYSSRR